MGIFHLLLIVFLTVPVIEIFLLLKVGSLIGTLPTVLLIILTAWVGAVLVRAQGLSTLRKVQRQLQNAELPTLEVLEGMVVMVAGALLVTPGFFKDTVGFICLVPAVRRFYLKKIIEHYIKPRFIFTGSKPNPNSNPHADNFRTIDAEFWHEDSEKKEKNS